MSETTPEKAATIDFERADFDEPPAEHVECGLCKKAIPTEYWQYLGKIVCAGCRDLVRRTVEESRRGATFGKAFLLGGLVALGCGIGYAIFVGVTQIQFALVTIGIGYLVGRTIQKVTRGFGTQKHQVLAVALTYFASTMGYLPAIAKELTHASSEPSGGMAAPGEHPAPAATPPADPEPSPPATPAREPAASPGSMGVTLVLALVVTTFFMLAAPFFELSGGISGVLGLVIIFFGLRAAWRAAKGVEATVTGPYQVGASSAA